MKLGINSLLTDFSFVYKVELDFASYELLASFEHKNSSRVKFEFWVQTQKFIITWSFLSFFKSSQVEFLQMYTTKAQKSSKN